MKQVLTLCVGIFVLAGFVSEGKTDVFPEGGFVEKAEGYSFDELYDLIKNQSVTINPIGGGGFLHYSLEDSLGQHHYMLNTRTWKRREVFDNDAVAKQLAAYNLKGEKPTAGNLRIYSPVFDEKKPDECEFSYKGRYFRYNSKSKELAEIPEPEKRDRGYAASKDWKKCFSADSLYYVCAAGHDLCLHKKGVKDSIRLTWDGEQYYSFATSGNVERTAGETCSAIGKWIGTSHKYFIVREDKRDVGTLSLVNNIAEGRPTVETYKFPMPGDKNIVRYEIYVADADKGVIARLDDVKFPDQKIVIPRFSRFPTDSDSIYFIRMNREGNVVELCRVDAAGNEIITLISEECPPHLNEQLFSYHILNDGKEILWWSERTGKGNWYLYDDNGKLKNAVCKEDFVAGNIVRIDTLDRRIIFEGYGKADGINPHYRFYYEASMDGESATVCLTPGEGYHSADISPDGKYIFDTYSRMDKAPRHQICDRKGKIKYHIGDCDLSALYKKGWKEPQVIRLTAADSSTALYGIVYLPSEIEEGRKYPIISNPYPGPHTDLVPYEFTLDDNGNHSLARLGFVVINFAYRGSGPYRGRDFYGFGYGNLRDYPLDDDYAVIRQIGEKYSFADTTKVGIYGHSGGGFMAATAMLTRPDFYKVGVAASGNYDNNIYTQWWGETFHGVSYNAGTQKFECRIPTTMELAGNLKGKLLLITGDMDNNVHPANTIRLAKALIDNDKYFDMMIIPGADHGLGNEYYNNLIRRYFVEHLAGEDPDSDNYPNKN